MGVRDVWRGRDPLPEDISERLGELGPILDKHDVELGYLFGSLAEGRPGNDIDLGLLSSRAVGRELRDALAQVLDTDRVHLVDLAASTEFLQREVVTTGEILSRRSEETQRRYEEHLLRDAPGEEPSAAAASQLAPESTADGEAVREWIRQRWNALNCQVEQLWPHRECETGDLAGSADLRWEAERGLLAALTLVVNILEQLRALGDHDGAPGVGPRMFSRVLCAELRHLEVTRTKLAGDAEPMPAAELARRLRHALLWLPGFLRETHEWLAGGADSGK
jgi:predicted nucleotidyltransferase